ncbi:hypothetical protein [Alicyclobacillus dauci]|uniref:Neutral/alkaline non-lysosomal ceramidase, N-terminal n=1 Tax=Alicyclobacillus dauci TaxID=1475485 RepID=A0ABY6Z0C6_9BACL|nr:hypothetical protein [Alicyclobacillus dauci]WAH36028.1 hypothetical protein NZD86_17455 [Alicyclobacillus dauci]
MARKVLNVTPGLLMWGYADRTHPGEGSHDELCVTAACFRAEGDRVYFLVSLDLLDFPFAFSDAVNCAVADQLPGTDTTVQLTASHTHAGPSLIDESRPNQIFAEHAAATVVEACLEAYGDLRTVSRTEVTSSSVSGFGAIRRTGEITDIPLSVQSFYTERDESETEDLYLVLFQLPCHPTVLSDRNLCYSSEWPGAAVRQICSRLGPSTHVMYLPGASGDISTRQTRRDQRFAEVERFGRMAADAVVASLDGEVRQTSVVPEMRMAELKVTLEPARSLSHEELDALRAMAARSSDERTMETMRQAIQWYDSVHSQLSAVPVDVTVRVFKFADVIQYVFWPGEPFSSFAQRLRDSSDIPTVLVGYCGHVGYLPDQTPIADPSYEVLMSVYGRDGSEGLLQASETIIHDIRGGV